MDNSRNPAHIESGDFLPDFCQARVLFGVVVSAELLAFVLSLGPARLSGEFWLDLGLVSLFIQWVALTTSAILCISRPAFQKMTTQGTVILAALEILVVVVSISLITIYLLRYLTLDLSLTFEWKMAFVLKNLGIGAIVSFAAMRYFYVWSHWRRQVRAETEARLQALQARIRPHFLFNSMNTVASLIAIDPQKAEDTLLNLTDLFRATLTGPQDLVPLHNELELARGYLDIEQQRLGDRLQLTFEIEDGIDEVKLPALTLQPLLENAVYHGIEPSVDPGQLRIKIDRHGQSVHIEIINSLPSTWHNDGRQGLHMAQANVADRLQAHFSDQAGLETEQDEHNYRVKLWLPLIAND